MARFESGEWPAPADPAIHWSCNNCLMTWKGGLDCELACCSMLSQDSILFHVEEIAKKLCDTSPLECQGPIELLSPNEATSILLSPHGRGYYGLVRDSWDISSSYSLTATCNCIYDKMTIQTDTGVPDDILNEEMETGDNTNSNPTSTPKVKTAAMGAECHMGS